MHIDGKSCDVFRISEVSQTATGRRNDAGLETILPHKCNLASHKFQRSGNCGDMNEFHYLAGFTIAPIFLLRLSNGIELTCLHAIMQDSCAISADCEKSVWSHITTGFVRF